MGKIFCLIGKSGVGKNALYERIVDDTDLNITPIIPYTTRPKRKDEKDGNQYHFVSTSYMQNLDSKNEIIERREYLTTKGIWHYFTKKFTNVVDKNYIIITTPSAIANFLEEFGSEYIAIVLLKADDKTRLERSIARESTEKNPNYSEVCRRYLADEKDFQHINEYKDILMFNIDTNCDMDSCLFQFKAIVSNI